MTYDRSSFQTVQIVGFSDASTLAFGAVVYVGVETEKVIDVNLLMSKSHVSPKSSCAAPQKKLSILRLEY